MGAGGSEGLGKLWPHFLEHSPEQSRSLSNNGKMMPYMGLPMKSLLCHCLWLLVVQQWRCQTWVELGLELAAHQVFKASCSAFWLTFTQGLPRPNHIYTNQPTSQPYMPERLFATKQYQSCQVDRGWSPVYKLCLWIVNSSVHTKPPSWDPTDAKPIKNLGNLHFKG